jgi:eukaryotic-like serine/threonine-protein kinase
VVGLVVKLIHKRSKEEIMKQFAWMSIILILLAACASSATPVPTQIPTVVIPTETALPPTLTATSTPTELPTATSTPLPVIGSKWTRPADGMVMGYVPAGSFEMGSKDGLMTETVVHKVSLDGFWIDLTEVTNGMYDMCVQAGKCTTPSEAGSLNTSPSTHFGSPQYKDYPAIYLSWENANAYCAWAGVRLPTEAEWEMAARGEDGRTYPWGNTDPTCELANFTSLVVVEQDNMITTKDLACTDGTVAVGSLPAGASPYGALDMAGNVYEWTADWFGDYPNSAATDPIGAASGVYRVARGGAWNITVTSERTYSRFALDPGSKDGNLGFRCARPLQ